MSEKVDVFMPIFWGDYLADTMGFTTEEHGAYMLLIAHYWRNGGPIRNDDRELLQVTRLPARRGRKVLDVVRLKFVVVHQMLTHKRIDNELLAARARKAKCSEKASKAARARWKGDARSNATSNACSTPQAMLEQCPSPSHTKIELSTNPKLVPEREGVFNSAREEKNPLPLEPKELGADPKYFNLEAQDISSGRFALRKFPHVYMHQHELESAKDLWIESGLTHADWVQGLTTLQIELELKTKQGDVRARGGLASKFLRGFVLEEALKKKRSTEALRAVKSDPRNGENGGTKPPSRRIYRADQNGNSLELRTVRDVVLELPQTISNTKAERDSDG